MRTLAAGIVMAGFAMLGAAAPLATAEPADLVPYCSGDQTPVNANCRAQVSQGSPNGKSGLSPNLPFGTNPGVEAAI